MRQSTGARWSLTLYVSGASRRSTEAIETVRRICDEQLPGMVDLHIVDVREQPALVVADQVYVVPTLIRRLPEPVRQLVGDLSDPARVLAGLDLPPRSRPGQPTGAPAASPGSGGRRGDTR